MTGSLVTIQMAELTILKTASYAVPVGFFVNVGDDAFSRGCDDQVVFRWNNNDRIAETQKAYRLPGARISFCINRPIRLSFWLYTRESWKIPTEPTEIYYGTDKHGKKFYYKNPIAGITPWRYWPFWGNNDHWSAGFRVVSPGDVGGLFVVGNSIGTGVVDFVATFTLSIEPLSLMPQPRIAGVEITQSIQHLWSQHGRDNSLPMIAEKPTLVRVFIESRLDPSVGGMGGDVSGISGHLRITQGASIRTPKWNGGGFFEWDPIEKRVWWMLASRHFLFDTGFDDDLKSADQDLDLFRTLLLMKWGTPFQEEGGNSSETIVPLGSVNAKGHFPFLDRRDWQTSLNFFLIPHFEGIVGISIDIESGGKVVDRWQQTFYLNPPPVTQNFAVIRLRRGEEHDSKRFIVAPSRFSIIRSDRWAGGYFQWDVDAKRMWWMNDRYEGGTNKDSAPAYGKAIYRHFLYDTGFPQALKSADQDLQEFQKALQETYGMSLHDARIRSPRWSGGYFEYFWVPTTRGFPAHGWVLWVAGRNATRFTPAPDYGPLDNVQRIGYPLAYTGFDAGLFNVQLDLERFRAELAKQFGGMPFDYQNGLLEEVLNVRSWIPDYDSCRQAIEGMAAMIPMAWPLSANAPPYTINFPFDDHGAYWDNTGLFPNDGGWDLTYEGGWWNLVFGVGNMRMGLEQSTALGFISKDYLNALPRLKGRPSKYGGLSGANMNALVTAISTDKQENAWACAHEFGHRIGLRHVIGPGGTWGTPAEPFNTGFIPNSASPYFGRQIGSMGEVGVDVWAFLNQYWLLRQGWPGADPGTALRGGNHMDVMSYGDPRWVTPYSWVHYFDRLTRNDFRWDNDVDS
jgi:hypothetical protein